MREKEEVVKRLPLPNADRPLRIIVQALVWLKGTGD